MEFIINKNELMKALSNITGFMSTREINQIISNVLLETEKGYLTITATDLEKSIRNKIPAEVFKEGSILLPGKKLSELVKGFRYEVLKFFVDESHRVIIKNGNEELEKKYKTNIEIMGNSPEEFPIPFKVNNLEFFDIEPSLFMEMIQKVEYATAIDDPRVVFNGIFLEHKDDLLTIVATDGRRLSYIKRLEKDFLKGSTIIIPSRSVKEIIKILSNTNELKIAYNDKEKQIYLQSGDLYFSTRLVEGNFPDYRVVIPKDLSYKVTLNRQDFISAIRQAMVFAPEPNKQVQLHFKENLLMIVSSTPDLGKIEDGIDCEYQEKPIAIGFNANYLLDVLEALKSNEIEFHFKTPDSPSVILDPNDKDFLAIVMPMKIQD